MHEEISHLRSYVHEEWSKIDTLELRISISFPLRKACVRSSSVITRIYTHYLNEND